MARPRVVVTGSGAVCASGGPQATPRRAVLEGRPQRDRPGAPVGDATGWPVSIAGEVPDFNPRALVDDRKLHKLIRRTDLSASTPPAAGDRGCRALLAHRDALATETAARFSDRSGRLSSARAAATTRTSTTIFR